MAAMDVMGDKPEGWKRGGRLAHGGAAEREEEREEHGEAKKGGKMRMRRASGGTTTNTAPKGTESINVYNAPDAPETKSASDRNPSFKAGGKLKDGGAASGEMTRPRHDRHQRGGGVRTPYSSGSQLKAPSDSKSNRGYEGSGPA